jgi:hypothetical protein
MLSAERGSFCTLQTLQQAAQGNRIAALSPRCSGFVAAFGMLSSGIAGGTDFTNSTVTSASSAILTTVKDDLQVKCVPASFGKGALQIPLCFNYVPASGEAPSLCQSMDMRIDRKGRHPEGLRHDNASGLVSHSG